MGVAVTVAARKGGESADDFIGAAGASTVGSLGLFTNYSATIGTTGKTPIRVFPGGSPSQRRYKLQEAAVKLVPHERVARCFRYLRAGESQVEVLHAACEGRAFYGKLEVCGSVWLCPVCSARVAEARRKELDEGVRACEAGGGSVLHLTLTVQHSRQDDLALLLYRFARAWDGLNTHRAFKDKKASGKRRATVGIMGRYGIMGFVRAQEVTHGQNGWHPHYHLLLFLSRPLTAPRLASLEAELRVLWASSAAKEKLSMNDHGLTLRRGAGAAAGYVAKWGLGAELAKSHVKTGRLGSVTPWDLLRAYAGGDVRSGFLWREYAAAFKGKRQLFWSHNMRALLGLEEEVSDAVAAAALPRAAVHLGWITLADWFLVLRHGKRGDLLDLAGGGDFDVCREFLAGLRGDRRAERLRLGLDAPPVLVIPPLVQLHFLAMVSQCFA